MITKIVVMGGFCSGVNGYVTHSSTEILDVNTMTWGIGPNLPIDVFDHKGVQSVSETYLGFSIGGYCSKLRSCKDGYSKAQSKIFGLKKTNENVYVWEEVHNMTTARWSHSVVNAPKNLLPNC